MMKLKHWQDAVNAVLGVWLILSPWAVGFQGEAVATTNAVVVGAALLAAALGAILFPRAWEEWVECGLGAWLLISPWALTFSMHDGARVNAVTTGIVIVALALWTVFSDKEYSAWWRSPTPR